MVRWGHCTEAGTVGSTATRYAVESVMANAAILKSELHPGLLDIVTMKYHRLIRSADGHWVLFSRREDRLPTLRKPGRIKSPRNISLSRYSTVAHSVIHPVHPVHTHSPSTSILVIMPSSRWVIPGSKSLDALPVRSSLKLRDRSLDSSPLSIAY